MFCLIMLFSWLFLGYDAVMNSELRYYVKKTFYDSIEYFRSKYKLTAKDVSELARFEEKNQYAYDRRNFINLNLKKAVLYCGAVRTSVSRALNLYDVMKNDDSLPYFHLMQKYDSRKYENLLHAISGEDFITIQNDVFMHFFGAKSFANDKSQGKMQELLDCFLSISDCANGRFWKSVAEVLKHNETSQRQLAMRLNIDYPAMNKYINLKYPNPGIDIIYAVAKELSIDIDEAITTQADIKVYYDLFDRML